MNFRMISLILVGLASLSITPTAAAAKDDANLGHDYRTFHADGTIAYGQIGDSYTADLVMYLATQRERFKLAFLRRDIGETIQYIIARIQLQFGRDGITKMQIPTLSVSFWRNIKRSERGTRIIRGARDRATVRAVEDHAISRDIFRRCSIFPLTKRGT